MYYQWVKFLRCLVDIEQTHQVECPIILNDYDQSPIITHDDEELLQLFWCILPRILRIINNRPRQLFGLKSLYLSHSPPTKLSRRASGHIQHIQFTHTHTLRHTHTLTKTYTVVVSPSNLHTHTCRSKGLTKHIGHTTEYKIAL